jgi:pimeloyl-ACP methyl ester carboxylesterase
MFKYQDGYFKVNNTSIHYYRTGGRKLPFVLLHGATDNGLCWTPVAALLADRYDVIMPDAQGHGLSDRLSPDFSIKNHTRQIVALIRKLGMEKPFIMGHSMGAGTAATIAVEYPDLPGAIILEDPAWGMLEAFDAGKEEERAKQREAFLKSLTGPGRPTREGLIAQCRKDNPRWSEAEIIPWAESKLQFDPALFSMISPNPASYVEIVPRMKCPTLLIISDGGLVSPATAEHASRLWKSEQPFRWVRIEEAGHNIRREQFKAFMDALNRFLQEISPDN